MEPVATSAVAKAGLAVLIMLFGLLQDGLRKLEAEDYPGAIAAFTKVIEHKQADTDLRDRALLWRAVAYGKFDQMDLAKADLAKLLAGTRNADLRGQAFVAFGQLGGDPKSLLPKETPKEAFERTKKLGADQDVAGFRKRLEGDLAALLVMTERVIVAEGQGETVGEILQLCQEISYGGSEIGEGRDFGTARVTGMVEDMALSFQLVAVGDQWHFATVVDGKPAGAQALEPEAAARRDAVQQVNRFKQIGLALFMCADDHGSVFPKDLKEAVPYLGDASLLEFADPATGKPVPLLYRSLGSQAAITNPSATYMVATPVTVAGQRVVAFADGHVQTLAEAEFLKNAKAQGWELEPKEPVKVPEDVAAKVTALITQLGDPKPAVRKAAYDELKALGDQAEPVLEKHRDHPDPEIRLTIRQLLK